MANLNQDEFYDLFIDCYNIHRNRHFNYTNEELKTIGLKKFNEARNKSLEQNPVNYTYSQVHPQMSLKSINSLYYKERDEQIKKEYNKYVNEKMKDFISKMKPYVRKNKCKNIVSIDSYPYSYYPDASLEMEMEMDSDSYIYVLFYIIIVMYYLNH